jgi:hypothetical protein
MLNTLAPPAAHRAPSGGSPVRAWQGPDATGHHRQPSPRHEPQRTMQALMRGLGALIVLGICGLTGFFIVADERRGHDDATTATRPPEDNLSIRARAFDPRPLTLDEVFPTGEIRLAPGTSPYRVGVLHIDSDCRIATTGQVGTVLDAYGCNQVVRADVTAPYGGYQVTAGLFNLADAAGADRAGDEIQRLVEAGGGTFAAMAAGDFGSPPPVQVGWRGNGHYLVYCVIARPDGQLVRDDDPYAERIIRDLVESYLGDQVIGQRALRP